MAGADGDLLPARHQHSSPRIRPPTTSQFFVTPQSRLILTQLDKHPECDRHDAQPWEVLADPNAHEHGTSRDQEQLTFESCQPGDTEMRVVWRYVVWCCVVRRYNNVGEKGNFVKTRTPVFARYGHPWTSQNVRKRSFSPTHCFFLHFSLGFTDVVGQRSYPKRPKRHFVCPRSCSKGPDHALEKVLTCETPCISICPPRIVSHLHTLIQTFQWFSFYI